MKDILKISKYIAVAMGAVFLMLIILSYLFQDKVTRFFVSELNKGIITTVNVKKIRLSLIKNFPRPTLEFKNVSIKSPVLNTANPDSLISKRNLLAAEELTASFRVRDILKKQYTIEKITLDRGSVFIITDGYGNSNLNIWKEEAKSNSSPLSLALKNLRISNTLVTFCGEKSEFLLETYISTASGRIELGPENNDIDFRINTDIQTLLSHDKQLLAAVSDVNLRGRISVNPDSLFFETCSIRLNKQLIEVNGSVRQKQKRLALGISSSEALPEKLLACLPEKFSESILQKIKGGTIRTELSLYGSYKPDNKLCLEGNLEVNKLIVSPSDKIPDITINNLKSEIEINLCDINNRSEINISSYSAIYAGSEYYGSAIVRNPNSLWLDLQINGITNLGKLNSYHSIKGLDTVSGNIHTNIRLTGNTGNIKDIKTENFLDLKRYINLSFSDVHISSQQFGTKIKRLAGNIMISDNIWIDELSFEHSGQNIVLNGRVKGLTDFIRDRSGGIEINAGLWADRFDFETIKSLTSGLARKSSGKKPKFTDIITAHFTLNLDSLYLGNFHSSQVDGSVSFRNGFLNVSSFNMLAFEGSISGNAGITGISSGGYMTRGWFEVDEANINSAFKTFNNFGQTSLKAENIEGYLTGSFSLSARTDSSFKPIISSLNATGNYSINNGALLSFEPLRKLSNFIEISELEDIRFEELHNDLLIKESRLLIPSMDISSSAFNISLSGEQSFEGDYEYHLEVLLSEILGKQATGSKSYLTEFGTVTDDGLGRTTLYLKLKSGPDGTDVSYDVKKLSEDIKSDLRDEKQNLKTILNEEYGWYRGDSLNTGAEEKSKKFRITWEEADLTEQIEEPKKKEKISIFKKLKRRTANQQKSDTINKKL